MIDKNFKENKCILPWVSFAVSSGNVGKMCTTTKYNFCIVDKDTNLKQVWCGDEYSRIRDEFLSDKIPNECKTCYKLESYGLNTRRTRFRKWIYDFFKIEETPKIRYLDINFSNLCNLNCAMCSSEYSSAWFKYDKEAIDDGLLFRKEIEPFMTIKKVPKEFIDQIEMKDLIFVEVKGGEPLIDPSFSYFIDKFIKDSGTAHVLVTSNLTSVTDEMKEKLSRINLILDISIDGVGEVYEYIRGPKSSLEKVKQNLLSFLEMKNVVRIRVNVTTSPYNLWNSYKLIPWILNMNPEIQINWCPMTIAPEYLAPSILPYEMRIKAADNIEKYVRELDPPKDSIVYLDGTLNYLRKENPEGFSKEHISYLRDCFLRWTDKLNHWRGMNIYKIVPELDICKDMIINNWNKQ